MIALAGWGVWISAGDYLPAGWGCSADAALLASCLILEAGGEGRAGMQAVMNVISNRAGGRPELFAREVLRPRQFSAFNSVRTAADRQRLIDRARAHPRWSQALQMADLARRGQLPDITLGATHYYATHLPAPPAWASQMTATRELGGHRFFRASACDPVVRRLLALR
jgi:N-acetylmuramoyl-L-alanine amidase